MKVLWQTTLDDPRFCGLEGVGGLAVKSGSITASSTNGQDHDLAFLDSATGSVQHLDAISDVSGGGFFWNDVMSTSGGSSVLIAGTGHGSLFGEGTRNHGVVYKMFISFATYTDYEEAPIYKIRSSVLFGAAETTFIPVFACGDPAHGVIVGSVGSPDWPANVKPPPIAIVVKWGQSTVRVHASITCTL
jgi:hypothetical protein